MVYKVQGIILRGKDVGGYDRLFWIYTKERGKILVKAKSVRKKESKLNGLLEIFNYGHFLIAQGKNIDTITNVWLYVSWPKIRKNLSAIWVAYYFCELADRLINAPEVDLGTWRLLTGSFVKLEQGEKNTGKLSRFFEYKLLEFLGYQPEVNIKINSYGNFSLTPSQLARVELISKKSIKNLLDGVPVSARFLSIGM
ncbi:MAG: DNA repair protein RecO [Candidatus Portnoybacteria bacterium CG10_big_fil_rev_8_21_14_0_10_36_7]|uniref:DNA repair protein RecO n=1 Tax=Candidatus Portnoybacteria bacterium CG10_big_fil_rev_8_21_14_0_10_36_7 TaxID=1974812 RepID=A0A2M8KD98_9BACT|nr:MAG: DNA repair protein RecO [Candidatus Portnoybacteria bacterium CG10_big_fil_rev_8_21_14_0_10_36_7]